MNRDEGQYHLSHVYDELLLPKDKNELATPKRPQASVAVDEFQDQSEPI